MLLRTVYTVTPDGPGPGQIALPLNLALGDGMHASLAKHHRTLRLVVDRLVDASRLEIVEESGWFRELSSGEREPRYLACGSTPTIRLNVLLSRIS